MPKKAAPKSGRRVPRTAQQTGSARLNGSSPSAEWRAIPAWLTACLPLRASPAGCHARPAMLSCAAPGPRHPRGPCCPSWAAAANVARGLATARHGPAPHHQSGPQALPPKQSPPQHNSGAARPPPTGPTRSASKPYTSKHAWCSGSNKRGRPSRPSPSDALTTRHGRGFGREHAGYRKWADP